MVRRYNERCPVAEKDRFSQECTFMKLRVLALASIVAVLSASALAQDDKQNPQPQPPASSQSQPADQSQTQPAADQSQATPDATQPADDKTNGKEPNVKHDGGKNDVDSIGNRKVGG